MKIFTKLGISTDIVEIWFGIANGQISSNFDRFICLPHHSGGTLSFYLVLILLSTKKILGGSASSGNLDQTVPEWKEQSVLGLYCLLGHFV